MRHLLLVIMFVLIGSAAHASCPSTLELQDANGVKAAAKYTDDGSGNCMVNTAIQDGADVTLGAKADAAWTTGTGSLIAIAKAIATNTNVAVIADPCSTAAKSNFAIATTTGTQVVAGSASKKVYVCSVAIIAATATNVNLIEGTGANCVTAATAAIFGSTTAANGAALVANGGFTLGSGSGTIGSTATVANGVCITQSGTAALAGNVTYVQQ